MGCVYGYDDIHHNLRFWLDQLVTGGPRTSGGGVVIYDIGANDGELTLPYVCPPHRVVAFEPQPEVCRRLRERAEQAAGVSAAEGLRVVSCALGAREGTAVLHRYSDDTFSTLHQRSPSDLDQYDLAAAGEISVEVVPLDTAVSRNGLAPPDIIKIDVEGAEREVLLGATQTLHTARPAIIMEYSCINTGNAGYPREELLQLLRDARYDGIFGLYRNRDTTLYTGSALESCRIWNIIAVPLDRYPGVASAVTSSVLPEESISSGGAS